MKTISELQQEIRSMQIELNNISEHLTDIDNELLNYKDTGKSESVYKKIYEIAEAIPVIEHPIINYDYSVKNNYFAILILIATCENNINNNQLLFLQRMIMADSQRTSIDLYMAGVGSISPEDVIFKIKDDIKKDMTDRLILDMLIIANMSSVKSRKTYEIIADVAALLAIDKETLTCLSQIATAILKQDIMIIKREMKASLIIRADERYGYYLCKISGWDELLIGAREKQIANNIGGAVKEFYNVLGQCLKATGTSGIIDVASKLNDNKTETKEKNDVIIRTNAISEEQYGKGEPIDDMDIIRANAISEEQEYGDDWYSL